MLDEIEKSFIECFVVKSKQDRLLFELGGKKRRDGVRRFCHNAEDILKPEKIMVRFSTKVFNSISISFSLSGSNSPRCASSSRGVPGKSVRPPVPTSIGLH